MAIEFRSETVTATNGALVEVATVTHEGRDFTNLGAIVDTAGGFVAAYVTEREGKYTLTTWEGKEIAPLRLTGKWMQRGFYGVKNTIYAWSATIEGRTYSGRNSGASMFVRMRAGKWG